MNITIQNSEKSTKKNAANRLQKRFNKLQVQLQKERKRNEKFECDIHELVSVYQNHSLKKDSELIPAFIQLADKLIIFFGRKSLSNWHRQELSEWIMEIILRVDNVSIETGTELHQKFREKLAEISGLTLEELEEQEKMQTEALKDAFECFEEEPETEDFYQQFDTEAEDPQIDMFDFEDIFDQAEANSRGDKPFEAEENYSESPTPDQKSILNGTWAKRLFRRAAQMLHPDREPDPELRKEKEQAMQELLKAREDGDILSLLRLYSETTDDEILLAAEEMTSACEMIESQIESLNSDQFDYLHADPIRLFVYQQFYDSSKKVREKNIREWKNALATEKGYLSTLSDELRNLKILKIELENRYEDKMMRGLEMGNDYF